MPKSLIPRDTLKKSKPQPPAPRSIPSVRKLKILITIVDRSKTMFYEDLLEEFEVNVQTVLYGHGTANTQMLELLGAVESDKSIIISFIREDRAKEALDTLTEKFHSVRRGKGIAFTVLLDSIIGVAVYQLLSNDPSLKQGEKQ